MKNFFPPTGAKLFPLFASLTLLATIALDQSFGQPPASAPATPAPAPKLTPEQRREFALLQQQIMADAEYNAAVKRAVEAQRAADDLFFAKMAKAAKPELQSYLKFLKEARSPGSTGAP